MSEADVLAELSQAVKNYLAALDAEVFDATEADFRLNELRAAQARAERHV